MLDNRDKSFEQVFGEIKEEDLIPIIIHGKRYRVPGKVNLLRAYQYITMTGDDYIIKLQKHCWGGTCENCKSVFKDEQLGEAEGLACQMDVEENLEVVVLPVTMKRKI